MPHIRIPQTGTTIEWPPADAGRIRINATLHISGQSSESGIGIELSFKRTPFRRLFKRSDYWCRLRSYAKREAEKTQPLTTTEQEELDRFRPQLSKGSIEQLPPDLLRLQWGHDIAAILQEDSYADSVRRIVLRGHPSLKSPSCKPLQIIDGHFQSLDYRLRIDREDLKSLRTVIATEAGASRLLFAVQWCLLPTILIDWALRGRPRGRNANMQLVMAVIPTAVLAAVELVVKAGEDRSLRARMHDVTQADQFAQHIVADIEESGAEGIPGAQRRLAMLLADRALRPALTRFRIKSFLDRDISEILDPATRTPLARLFKVMPDVMAQWFELLLGPEGQAARALKLIP